MKPKKGEVYFFQSKQLEGKARRDMEEILETHDVDKLEVVTREIPNQEDVATYYVKAENPFSEADLNELTAVKTATKEKRLYAWGWQIKEGSEDSLLAPKGPIFHDEETGQEKRKFNRFRCYFDEDEVEELKRALKNAAFYVGYDIQDEELFENLQEELKEARNQ